MPVSSRFWGRGEREDARAAMVDAEPILRSERPDILGGFTMWFDEGHFIDLAYFESEHAAREGEAKELSEQRRAVFQRFGEVLAADGYADIPSRCCSDRFVAVKKPKCRTAPSTSWTGRARGPAGSGHTLRAGSRSVGDVVPGHVVAPRPVRHVGHMSQADTRVRLGAVRLRAIGTQGRLRTAPARTSLQADLGRCSPGSVRSP